jgi:WhiB family transcriptional regulator, redox-sensing transcriptional regulator
VNAVAVTILGHMEARPAPGVWAEQAACSGCSPDLFYPERGGRTEEAKKVCAICPVRKECLDHALAAGEVHGIWGGLSEKQRRRVRRDVRIARSGAA